MGAKIKTELYKQYQELKEKGVAYELNGERIRENHFDFVNTIIKELQTAIDLDNYIPIYKSDVERDKQWREGVGSAQKLLPMHVVYLYCGDVSINWHKQVPEFIELTSPSQQIYNCLTDEFENWFHPNSRLGVDFAIIKVKSGDLPDARRASGFALHNIIPNGSSWHFPWFGCRYDLFAMKTLSRERLDNFLELDLLLNDSLVCDNQNLNSQSCSI